MLIGGGEGSTFDPACTLRNSSGNQIQVVRTGTTSGTFTGLSRYTQYQLVAYAGNSAGSVYSSPVIVWTLPENPTIAKPVVSNIGRTSATVTPGIVTDDGGKAITEVETYIKGGSYGNALTSIGKGTSAKSVTGLKPNTSYQVITRATNGLTEYYSDYTTFTTIGNPPTITDVYASSLSLTGSTINYTATYEHNAEFQHFKVQWRYPGSSTWNTLSTSNNKITGTNFDSLSENRIEYRITVTDNWNRSTISPILNYTVIFDYSNDITNLKCVENSDGSYTISGNWTKRLRTKAKPTMLLGTDGSQHSDEIVTTTSTTYLDSITDTSFSTKTKIYKNKRTPKTFCLYIRVNNSNNVITKYINVPAKDYPNPINIINKNGSVSSNQMFTITKDILDKHTIIKSLRQHDIIKLSRTMRYIDIDSRGTYDNKNIFTNTITLTLGVFNIEINYTVKHISGILYSILFNSIKIKTTNGKNVRIRNNSLSLSLNDGNSNYNYKVLLNIPNITVTSNYLSIDPTGYATYFIQDNNINTTVSIKLQADWRPEFDVSTSASNSNTYSKTIECGNADVANNHLVNIKVIDENGIDRASGKTLKLTDGSSVISYNGGTATNGNTDSNKFIYSNNGLPLRLDLGAEYKIKQIQIQRRILSNNEYPRNYIIGRNKNLELCYIFYDSNVSDMYIETNKIYNVN